MPEPTDLLTVAEAAKLLKVSPGTIYALCKSGKLTHYRFGQGRGTVRIDRKAISELMRHSKTERQPEEGRVTIEDLRRTVGRKMKR